ncbi:hypothetical protein GOV07_00920 [Candidatus Woesearchaeota archaeon]|nr:hypothetical protein [Candidatus Woesearchaeota archaeon]
MPKEDDVLYEIDEIRRELKKIVETQAKILAEETLIKNQTQAVLAEETRVEQRLTKMKFSDITAWKNSIWEHCQYKESRSGERAISYWCTKLDSPCKFEDCPLNQY